MALVDLELLKAHVHADDFSADDNYLDALLEAAEAWVVKSTRRTPQDLMRLNHGELPPELRQAILLLAGHWYNQREAASAVQMHTVPFAVDALVKPFVRLV